MVIAGIAFMLGGFGSLYYGQTSARPEVAGQIVSLKQFFGKYPSSEFAVEAEDGSKEQIHASYNGDVLRDGLRVRVQFVHWDHILLELTILSGPDEGWRLQESDESWASILLGLMGIALQIGAWFEFRKIRNHTKTAAY